MSGDMLISFFTSMPMWVTITPIVICSIVSLAVIIERIYYYRRINHDYRFIMSNVLNYIRQNNHDSARLFCDSYVGPIVHIIKEIVSQIAASSADREGIILGTSRSAIVTIEKNIGIIATIATISPMLGLFGTVTGLLKAFAALSRGGRDASALLAYGVSEALITTVLGLLVAIPSWVFYNYMVARVEFYIKEVEYVSNVLSRA